MRKRRGALSAGVVVRLGLEALIAREGARRLADLGGAGKHLRTIRRRRPRKRA
jgi:hypothetical protein